jgi:hypothetical protein
VGIFGDVVPIKQEHTLRIGFQNMGGFNRQGLIKREFDIFSVAETNVEWQVVHEEDKLLHRTKE